MSTVLVDAWADELHQVEQTGLRAAVLECMTRFAVELEGEAKRRAPARTSALRRSITAMAKLTADGGEIKLQAGSADVAYAAMQEYGGQVSPRASKYLAIPFGPALTAAGALKARFRVGSLRNVAGLFVVKKKDGRLFLAWKEGKALQVAFRLTKGPVTIPEQGYLRASVTEKLPDFVADLEKTIAAALMPGAAK